MLKNGLWLLPAIAILGFGSSVEADDAIKGDPYPLNVCAVSGEELGSMGEPIAFNHQGRDIKFCCSGCEPRFKGEPTKFIAEIDKKIIEQQLPHYPLKTDLVTGDALPADAKVLNVVYMNRLVRLGDQKSTQKFLKEPEAYIAKLDEAVIAAQLESYPLDVCIVSGEPLDAMGEPVQKVYANRLVQFCCDGCVNKFVAQPAKFWPTLDGKEGAEFISPEEIHKDDHKDHH